MEEGVGCALGSLGGKRVRENSCLLVLFSGLTLEAWWRGANIPPEVSNLLASLGHTGRRRVVLGHTFSTQTLTKTGEQKKREIYYFVLGHIHSQPETYAVHGLWVGHPCQDSEKMVRV